MNHIYYQKKERLPNVREALNLISRSGKITCCSDQHCNKPMFEFAKETIKCLRLYDSMMEYSVKLLMNEMWTC